MPLPQVPEAFYWTNETWGPALRCRALDGIAPHLFTTRALQLTSPDEWTAAARAIGAATAVMLTQVHGNAVIVVRRGEERPAPGAEADILISDDPSIAIAVRAADCVPLLLGDRRTGAVAAVHAGWRGTAAAAVAMALQSMHSNFTTDPADVVVAIGPSIGPCCYEVGTELVDAFAAAGHPRHLVDRWFVAQPPRRGSTERPKLRLDVASANRDQLILAGVLEEHIHIAALCTAEHLDVLTSFRAEKEKAGRLAAVIRARVPQD